ncbi:Pex8p ASCRUDRAFT_70674 [Ascoidea rubescens DSM 1968]|uniref:Peroxisomal membrane protein PEX17 n=1 Tax=Ascoidea rubescens DSM 1968 TaxID=1344418 RepID=A0A1D2VGL9_9ASCO|nr:hypothetical protein ASCRUDRAFT_70674 [Ascoidea rubescens DSM 1968]ODV60808.1 hypothetical protein ASCRUDRAFT_70674 [Ascoidea rubescens DSM 1968]
MSGRDHYNPSPNGRNISNMQSNKNVSLNIINRNPTEIDLLFNYLRNPSSMTPKTILGYIVHYLPTLKNDKNVSLLISYLLISPAFFFSNNNNNNITKSTSIGLNDSYLVIEAIKTSFEKKIKISLPTLSIKNFYNSFLKIILQFHNLNINPLGQNLIISGILLADNSLINYRLKIPENIFFFNDFNQKILQIYSINLKRFFNNELYILLNFKSLVLNNFNNSPLNYLNYLNYINSIDNNNINHLNRNKNKNKNINININDYKIFETMFKEKSLMVISLACVFNYLLQPNVQNTSQIIHFKKNIPNLEILLLSINLLFNSKYGLSNINLLTNSNNSADNNLVLKHLNRLSFLIENSIINIGKNLDQQYSSLLFNAKNIISLIPLNNKPLIAKDNQIIENKLLLLDYTLTNLVDYSKNLNNYSLNLSDSDNELNWNVIKNTIFSIIIINKSFTDLSLSTNFFSNNFKNSEISSFIINYYSNILKILFFLNFILSKIGTGGFQSYKLIYLTSMNNLIEFDLKTNDREENKATIHENLSDLFLSYIPNYNSNKRPQELDINNKIIKSNLNFLLNYWEYLVQHCSQHYFNNTILPIINFFIEKPIVEIIKEGHKDLLENSHSVKLLSLGAIKEGEINLINYLEIILGQFPIILSFNQLNLAIKSISIVIRGNYDAQDYRLNQTIEEMFLSKIYLKINSIKSGIPLSNHNLNDFDPPSTKAAIACCLINIIPYTNSEILIDWLNVIYFNIIFSRRNALTGKEQDFLADKLWDIISDNLGVEKSNIAINWWYNKEKIETSLIPSKL